MKKIILLFLFMCLLVTGCRSNNSLKVMKDFHKKLDSCSGYQVLGDLSVTNNDEVYQYKVDVTYLKDHYYKVVLTNTSNDHTQIILKNDDGVYVLTPSLNKSFRFQSDWPYDNSQIYLLDALDKDLKRDDDITYKKNKDTYVFETKIHYPNNHKLKKQKVIFDKNMKPKKVIVYQNDGVEAMTMNFTKVKYSPKISKDDFQIDNIISTDEEKLKESSVLEDIIYPLFVPNGTKLVNEEKIEKTNGERVLMNYDGEKSFLLVEETADVFDEFTVIPTFGEPYLLMDTLGIITSNSLAWSSGGVDFYLVSDVMSQDELIEVAQSISGIVSMK